MERKLAEAVSLWDTGSSLCRDTGNNDWSSPRLSSRVCTNVRVKGKPIHVTGRGDPQGCETSRLPHFL
jgi:hypothetical protein